MRIVGYMYPGPALRGLAAVEKKLTEPRLRGQYNCYGRCQRLLKQIVLAFGLNLLVTWLP
jgi:hypothetical protein